MTRKLTPEAIAAKRGWQTLADGAIVVAVVAGIVPLVGAIQSAESWEAWVAGWQTWTWTAVQGAIVAGGTAVVSWLRRRFVQPPAADANNPRPEDNPNLETLLR